MIQLVDRLGLASTKPLRILVVEDSLEFARRLVAHLEEFGHEVVSLAGVDRIENGSIEGPALDLHNRVSCPMKGFDVAFLDHYFHGNQYDGRTLTEALCLHGSPRILAMSSDPAANRRMMKAGATMSLRKSDLARMLGTH